MLSTRNMNKILPKNIIIKSLTLMINKSLKYKEERHNTYIDIPENIDSRLKKKHNASQVAVEQHI